MSNDAHGKALLSAAQQVQGKSAIFADAQRRTNTTHAGIRNRVVAEDGINVVRGKKKKDDL
ncbi:hypothetical protein VM1G_08738 [Cytospora mali]|uniref:Uncharacterized protein n=1 Tax=Cytospora mali TaxID=578113 RepID=A0A194WA22_CYTMA|nr:hypothetical protein VM1G_08738 [Valsa mali]